MQAIQYEEASLFFSGVDRGGDSGYGACGDEHVAQRWWNMELGGDGIVVCNTSLRHSSLSISLLCVCVFSLLTLMLSLTMLLIPHSGNHYS